MREQPFLSAGKKTGDINVHLSYKIVALFSEGLYTSPNKAVEELVANSFDAGPSACTSYFLRTSKPIPKTPRSS